MNQFNDPKRAICSTAARRVQEGNVAGHGPQTKSTTGRHRLNLLLAFAGLLSLYACGGSSSDSPAPVPVAGATLTGAVTDGPVAGATVSAFALSPSGSILPPGTALATAITSPSGTYTLTLPTNTSGPVLVESSGGTYTDDLTGQKGVHGWDLSAVIPNVASTQLTPITAQLTPLTTLAAQFALGIAAAPGSTTTVSEAASTITALVGDYFGGQNNLQGTPIVDVSTPGCATGADVETTDATLVLAALNKFAFANQVQSSDLIAAVVKDLVPDGVLDGQSNGTDILVPLSGGGTKKLCSIEDNCSGGSSNTSLAQQIAAALAAFTSSGANVCGLSASTSLITKLTSPHPQRFTYTVGGSFSKIQGGGVVLQVNGGAPISIDSASNELFTFSTPFLPGATYDVEVVSSPGQTCTPSENTGSVGTNDVNTVSISCSATGAVDTLSFSVTGLTGTGLLLTDGFDIQGPIGNSAAFASELADGSPYAISVQTQPSNPTQTCTVAADSASGTVSHPTPPAQVTCVGGATAPAVYVIDSTNTLFAFDANGTKLAQVTLPARISNINGGGITTDAKNVYVTIGQSSTGYPHGAVLAYNKTSLVPAPLAVGSFSQVNVPRGIVYDEHNAQFYVGNGGSTVTTYGASGNFLGSFNGTGAIYGPSGVAFDATDSWIWVANYTGGGGLNPTWGVANFQEDGYLGQTIMPASQFLAPTTPSRELPYSIGYCASSQVNGTDYVAVGFLPDASNQGGTPQGGVYTTAGKLVSAFSSLAAQPNAISCSAAGTIYVAANDGLHAYSTAGVSVSLPSGGFAGLTAPIFGVFAQ